ncbi:hypothetical protein F5Y16DRAFT_407828 [Xylariaceae sp. FL0255]|nr:hypothetical protein F5Y16DRAFT_407828 [Xylariaceae sp. FL0255]
MGIGNYALPSDTESRPVTVLGGGVLGRRIAAVWAAGGYNVRIRDPSPQQRTDSVTYWETNASQFISSEHAKLGTVKAFEDLNTAVENAWLIIECVPEHLKIKIDTFIELEQIADSSAILCSNSSSYKSREFVENLQSSTKLRVLNMHYMMPPMNRIVELMTCGETDAIIFPFLVQKLQQVGMKPIVARKESTGFVINRMWAAIKRETLTILSEGVSVPEELDSVWIEMFGKNPAGPCMMMDAVGLDTVSYIEQHYMKERHLSGENTVDYLKTYLDEGKLGAKSSKGGLYPAGYTTKTAKEEKGHHDNLHAPTLYFLDIGLSNEPQEVYNKGRVLMGSSDGRPLKTIVSGEHLPDGLDVTTKAGHPSQLFWTCMGVPSENDGTIRSCNLDGSDVRDIVPAGLVHTPKQLHIDPKNSKIYFADREGLRVMRCNFDGSGLETLVQSGDWKTPEHQADQMRWCVGVGVSPRTGKFYWTQKGASKGSQGRIFRANINFQPGEDASNRTDIECLFQHLPEPVDLEVDDESNYLYWTDRVSFPGKDYEILSRNLHEAIGIKLDSKNRHIYATDLGGSVYRFNMDGTNRTKVYDGDGAFTGITSLLV